MRRLSAVAASFIAAEEFTNITEPRPGPEVEQLEAGAGGEAGAELGEGLLVPAHTVPLEVQPGEAGGGPQEVAQRRHAAARHVVTPQVQHSHTRAPHDTLQWTQLELVRAS